MSESAETRLVTISRTIDASRDLVFRMWSEPAFLLRWYAPRRCRLEVQRFEFHVGGAFRYRILEPDGSGCRCCAIFKEINAPLRIVYELSFCDEAGAFVTASSAGADADWPDITVVTVDFAESGGRTIMTLQQTVGETVARRTGAYPSWLEMLDRLDEQIPLTNERSGA
jgi:uncharacterized protein YndB with AHSA1/START domain